VQISVGQDLLGQVAAAEVIADLMALRGDVSVWSARNEAVLVKAFGGAAGQGYRLGTGAAVAARGFEQKRAATARRVEAGLRKLRNVTATLTAAIR
jgi:hypothetical protein